MLNSHKDRNRTGIGVHGVTGAAKLSLPLDVIWKMGEPNDSCDANNFTEPIHGKIIYNNRSFVFGRRKKMYEIQGRQLDRYLHGGD